MKSFSIIFLLSCGLLSSSCCKKEGYIRCHGPFHVLNDTTIEMNGDMGGRINKQFEKIIDKHPNIRLLVMQECPGSRDDESMMVAARLLRSLQINTHLVSDGKIESGAVDFYLAGKKRTLEQGGKFGVHAWSSGSKSATEYSFGHKEHDLYINYYKDIGYSQTEAEEMYYFIINAASADDIHWMTDQEINQYNFITQ